MSVEKMMLRFGLTVLSGVAILAVAATGSALAQSAPPAKTQAPPGRVVDCTDVSVDYANDPTLTREEKLALMDKALYLSLSKFDACQQSRSNANASATSGGGGGGGGGAAGAGGGSVASSDMSGTEKSTAQEGGGSQGPPPWNNPDAQQAEANSPDVGDRNGPQQASSSNGKVPEDIPAADNDSILEAQIRQAAINETDPQAKARLWNEYRKYKGLPAVK